MSEETIKQFTDAKNALLSNIVDLMESKSDELDQTASNASGVVITFCGKIDLTGKAFSMDVNMTAAATVVSIRDKRHVQGDDGSQPELGLGSPAASNQVDQPESKDEPAPEDDADPFGEPADAKVVHMPDPTAQPPPPPEAEAEVDDPFGPGPTAPAEVAPAPKAKAKKGK